MECPDRRHAGPTPTERRPIIAGRDLGGRRGVTTMRIGALEVAVVSDGLLNLDPQRLFGRVDEAVWRPVAGMDEHGHVPAGVNCALVRSGDRKILLDTGTGTALAAERGQACGRLLESLAALGTSPDEIDTVVVSHAHWDHVGGASIRSGDRWVPTFPSASYWFWRGEWEYWTNPELPDRPPFLDDVLPPLVEHNRLGLLRNAVGAGHTVTPVDPAINNKFVLVSID